MDLNLKQACVNIWLTKGDLRVEIGHFLHPQYASCGTSSKPSVSHSLREIPVTHFGFAQHMYIYMYVYRYIYIYVCAYGDKQLYKFPKFLRGRLSGEPPPPPPKHLNQDLPGCAEVQNDEEGPVYHVGGL